MTYTMEQARTNLDQLLSEAAQGNDVVIERAGKPAVRLAVTEAPDQPAPKGKRIPGQYAGQVNYPDELWKALETDEELREYGFDIMIDDGKPDDLAM
jgi:antitoxin (DNA-binding transcriptional repressor) of toxin-antitoxin stability system